MTSLAAHHEFDAKAFLAQVDDSDECARALDDADPLRAERALFAIPRDKAGKEHAYFCGNSLGLMPRSVPDAMAQELKDWGDLAVEGHFHAKNPWFSYHEIFREMGARLVGAIPGEVVMMNSLTVNLHLLMASFYRPTPDRYRILIEKGAFPSDEHAVASQARFYGFDASDAILHITPRKGEDTIREQDIESVLKREGESVALVLLGGVNLGALALPDIGQMFPDTDAKWDGADSGVFLERAVREARERGWRVANVDCTVILERPKLSPVKEKIRANLARLLGVQVGAVNVKGKTHEKVDAVGEGRAVEAHVVVLMTQDGEERL